MKVSVVRTGGFAGIERRGQSDTETDPVLRGLLARVDLTTLSSMPGRIPDQFVYEIDIDGHVITVGESRLTAPVRELVHHVLRH
jgi:hypothetical protein